MQKTNFSWLVKMAWRDSRRNRGRLFLFISSIILGIAALVAINSFSDNLQKSIDSEAQTLLGADLQIESNQPLDATIAKELDSLSTEKSLQVNFISMASFPKTGATRMSQIIALEGGYPYYGKMVTEPADQAPLFKNKKQALVDKTLMEQYEMQPGDSIKVGEVTFEIAAKLNSAPGTANIFSFAAPRVYIPMEYLAATKLVQQGSRVEYKSFFQFNENFDIEAYQEKLSDNLEETNGRAETVQSRKQTIGRAFGDLNRFLNLIGFVALLLGCIGVASAVHIYIKDKLSTVAILRCLGVSGRQSFLIYLFQIVIMGVFGAVIGALLGTLLQISLPLVLKDFLPIQNVSIGISWPAVFQGILIGLGISFLFAMLPLLAIRKTSPLRTLRASFEEDNAGVDPLRWLVYLAIVLFIGIFTFLQTRNIITTIAFGAAILIAFALLALVAKTMMWMVRRFFPVNWRFSVRQGFANLYRPNNQSLILIISIGLGTALIATLFFTRDLLLQQVEMTSVGEQPNVILFDIQPSQKEGVVELVKAHNLPVIQEVPIITIRLVSIDGVDKSEFLKDTLSKKPKWVYNREYRVTYRDTITDAEEVIEGLWHGDDTKDETGPIKVSISTRIAKAADAKVSTKLVFDVQGVEMETVVTSIREVDFARIQPNFFVVFPTGVLEEAPQQNVVVTRVESKKAFAEFQQAAVQKYTNITILDLGQLLASIEQILGKVSFAIRFMALFSILTGLVVLIGSIALSKYQRIRESVLLRTLGAQRKQILWINGIEYFLLGTLATLTGILLALVASWALARFAFNAPFTVDWIPVLLVFIAITGLTVFIGMFNNREVLSKPPLEVLRS